MIALQKPGRKSWIQTVFLTLTLTVSVASAQERPDAQVWTIAIGIDGYEDPNIPPCRGAGRDARAIRDWFLNTAGWKTRHVLFMNDRGDQFHGQANAEVANLRPTRENLNWALTAWLDARVKPGDIIVVYYAGQATARPPQGRAPSGNVYLLPIDANLADLDKTGWRLDESIQIRASRGDNPIILWLDTSLNGREPGGLSLPDRAPKPIDWLRSLARWPGVTAWLAASGRPAPEGQATSPFVQQLANALGDPEKSPRTLLGALAELRKSMNPLRLGFQTIGGVEPDWSIWPAGTRVPLPPVPELVVQRGHAAGLTAIQTTADGERIITASQDSTIRIWRARDGALLRVLTEPLAGVTHLSVTEDGHALVYGDGAGRVAGWDLRDDRPLVREGPPLHEVPIIGLTFLPEGRSFVSIDADGKSFLWDARRRALTARPLLAEPIVRIKAATQSGKVALAAIRTDGKLHLFSQDGALQTTLEGPRGTLTALDLSADGRFVGVGNDAGIVQIWETNGGAVLRNLRVGSNTEPGKIQALKVVDESLCVAADATKVWKLGANLPAQAIELKTTENTSLGQALSRLEISADGVWIAGTTEVGGRIALWSNSAGAQAPRFVAVPQAGFEAVSLKLSLDSNSLLVGCADGSWRRWELSNADGAPRAIAKTTIEASRGRVAGLSPGSSGRYLLERNPDGHALVWDLQDGREPKILPGLWAAGAFLPGDRRIALIRSPEDGGDVVLFDRENLQPLNRKFPKPLLENGLPSQAAFGTLAVSKSGRYVAAASLDVQAPLACLWETETGKLIHFTRDHDAALTSVDISGDERWLLTASLDGTVKVWPIEFAQTDWHNPRVVLRHEEGNDDPGVAAARFNPADAFRIVTGTRGGQVRQWNFSADPANPSLVRNVLTRLEGAINAIELSADGRYLGASGMLDKSIRLWRVPERAGASLQPIVLRPRPNHVEQVTSLGFFPGSKLLVTGSDDATIRFWDLASLGLLGTMTASVQLPANGGRPQADWLAFTSDGLYDGSQRGESLVRWRVGAELRELEQYQDTHYAFGLLNALRIAQRPETPKPLENARRKLAIVSPEDDFSTLQRQVELTIALDDPGFTGVRLYQDGVPVQADNDFGGGTAPNRVKSLVTLRSGENRFYAMASRPGAIDGRSNEVVIRYQGADPPGRVHVLAVGISDYERRKLKYAHVDADSLSKFLHTRGVNAEGEPGELILRTDRQVSERQLDEDFRTLRTKVKGHPEDTVVLFLAGHTDVFRDQFCLLLPTFPFPEDAPELVAMRGNLNRGNYAPSRDDPNILPYVTLYNRLSRLEALQRLVIIDACQAGAVLNDPAVKKVQSLIEVGARKARNSYLLASRVGEPATEADVLSHGLLTYVLLKGMGETSLKTFPASPLIFQGQNTADLNRDGLITTDELRQYAETHLPRLSAQFPELAKRSGPNPPASNPATEPRPQLQGAEQSFPIVVVPQPNPSRTR